MYEDLSAEVARSLDAPRAALAHLPELFADLDALGTSPRRVVNWLATAGVGADTCVIDLGCGKGAAAVELAARVGCSVVGIDAFEPFVAAARVRAVERGVAGRCRFSIGDYRRVLRLRRRFDAGIMLSVAPVEVAAAALHRLVKPGGVYVIDDAVWVGHGESSGVLRAKESRQVFENVGDTAVREHVYSPGEVRRMEERMQRLIQERARGLATAHPHLRPVLREMLARQRWAVAALTTGPLRPALWMVERGGSRAARAGMKGRS